jgi:predicted dehydrogenase
MKPRWAVFGTGRMAATFLNVLKQSQKQVTAVVSSDFKRAQNFALKHGIQNFYSYENIDFDKFDIAYIATVNKRHMPDSLMCLQKGKSVLCEKPIAINMDELQAMTAAAKENNALLAEALWTAYLPAIHKTKELINDGAIGKVVSLDCRFCINIPRSVSRLYDQNGGGALLDIGIYNMFLARLVLGDFTVIKTLIKRDPQGIDLVDKIVLENIQGAKASLISSIKKKIPNIKAVILGEKGKIILPYYIGADKVILKTKGQAKTFSFPHKINGYEYEIEYFEQLQQNNQKQSPIFSLKDSQELLKVIQNILKNLK